MKNSLPQMNKDISRLLLALAILLATSPLAAGTLYKCKQPDGSFAFSDSKCAETDELLEEKNIDNSPRYDGTTEQTERKSLALMNKGLPPEERRQLGDAINVVREEMFMNPSGYTSFEEMRSEIRAKLHKKSAAEIIAMADRIRRQQAERAEAYRNEKAQSRRRSR